MDDLMRYVRNNKKEVIGEYIEGEVIERECPHCKEKTQIEILEDGNGKCKKCNNKIDITWN
ncbi:hypothetical protein [Clostridium sp. KNHs214]|uniref:hypothetical protein n=1 Tax=Clostridium sp. KNHs214 TaxID=1540257 RepID=UPI001A9A49A9|nr:hypothetical protein [Clostridium sp. KNHs214]